MKNNDHDLPIDTDNIINGTIKLIENGILHVPKVVCQYLERRNFASNSIKIIQEKINSKKNDQLNLYNNNCINQQQKNDDDRTCISKGKSIPSDLSITKNNSNIIIDSICRVSALDDFADDMIIAKPH